MRTDHEIDQVTANWLTMNKSLHTLTEDELKRALARRLARPTSKQMAVRIHQRYCTLRDARERAEVLAVFEPMPDFLSEVV